MLLSRRALVRSAASVAIAAPALRVLGACAATTRTPITQRVSALALQPDPKGLLDLAPGLSYTVLSRTGDAMADGLVEPAAHDGMAAFPVEGDPDRCLLVRNHELSPGGEARSAFGADGRGAAALAARIYDHTPAGKPHPGGTTTVLVDLRTIRAERTHLSLAGTVRNCAGGPTPWGSWLSCEETQLAPGGDARKSHGFVFEVPAAGKSLTDPVPLTGLGRYSHEACAVDPGTGIVYLSEDTGDSLFYRFLPSARGELAKGGRLQALALVAQSGADTRNWPAGEGGDPAQTYAIGARYATRWVDLDHVDAPDGDLRLRGRKAGAAIFARGEGLAFSLEVAGPAIYFACTSGGAARKGQVWRYLPSAHEGTPREADTPGQIELFVESHAESEFDMVDNIVASPRGDLIMCEDGGGDQFVRAVAPDGLIYPIARNADTRKSEFCGCCFSPDGRVLFVNIQSPGVTLAITGDWTALRRNAKAAA
jgi:secreted PhoX family phosphatase